jgi:hypothetical protein
VDYDGTNFVPVSPTSIFGNNWDGQGTLVTGFDFSRTDGRDKDIDINSNTGYASQTPNATVIVEDEAINTTLTTTNVRYKLNGFNSKPRIYFDVAATAGTWTITYGGQTTAALAYNATTTNIDTALESLSNVANVTVTQVTASKEWLIEFTTAGEGFEPMTVDISNLTGPTKVTITPSFSKNKMGLVQNRITYLPTIDSDMVMTVTGNLQSSVANRNITFYVVKNGDSAHGFSAPTVRVPTANQPFMFAFVMRVPQISQNDYFELWASTNSGGHSVRIQDLQMFVDTRA